MPALGEAHHQAKLSDAEVKDLRRVWARWKEANDPRGYASIGALWNIAPSTARDIVNYRTRARGTSSTRQEKYRAATRIG